jgi:hypothetical protein
MGTLMPAPSKKEKKEKVKPILSNKRHLSKRERAMI